MTPLHLVLSEVIAWLDFSRVFIVSAEVLDSFRRANNSSFP